MILACHATFVHPVVILFHIITVVPLVCMNKYSWICEFHIYFQEGKLQHYSTKLPKPLISPRLPGPE